MSNIEVEAPVIELQKLSKIYVSNEVETHALAGIDLTINSGEYVSISGPSGCGKSTLLSILGLLDSPTSGHYRIDGVSVETLSMTDMAKLRNSKIGFIFQQFNLIDELSVYSNVTLPLLYSSKQFSEKEIKNRAAYCLDMVGLSHRTQHRPNQLSGGQQQRVAIARALVCQPSILLVDEPTGNLDSKNGDQVMEILENLNSQGTTIAMVTHDPRYADFAPRRVSLLDGKLYTNQISEVHAIAGNQ